MEEGALLYAALPAVEPAACACTGDPPHFEKQAGHNKTTVMLSATRRTKALQEPERKIKTTQSQTQVSSADTRKKLVSKWAMLRYS